MTRVRRSFVDVPHGQVHVRSAGDGGVPLVMLHASPFSAKVLEPLVATAETAVELRQAARALILARIDEPDLDPARL